MRCHWVSPASLVWFRSRLIIHSDLADAFPNGDFREYFRHDFLTVMARETRANADFSSRTRDTARWAREQIKRQIGTSLQSNPFLRPSRQPAAFS